MPLGLVVVFVSSSFMVFFHEFVPGVSSPRGSSSPVLGVSSPKESWGGVDDAALASGCRTAVAQRWEIRLIAANNAVRPMKADAAPGLYTLLPERRRRADVSDIYWISPSCGKTYITNIELSLWF